MENFKTLVITCLFSPSILNWAFAGSFSQKKREKFLLWVLLFTFFFTKTEQKKREQGACEIYRLEREKDPKRPPKNILLLLSPPGYFPFKKPLHFFSRANIAGKGIIIHSVTFSHPLQMCVWDDNGSHPIQRKKEETLKSHFPSKKSFLSPHFSFFLRHFCVNASVVSQSGPPSSSSSSSHFLALGVTKIPRRLPLTDKVTSEEKEENWETKTRICPIIPSPPRLACAFQMRIFFEFGGSFIGEIRQQCLSSLYMRKK